MLKLKFQCFCHLMQRGKSSEKTLMLGKIEGKRRRDWVSDIIQPLHSLPSPSPSTLSLSQHQGLFRGWDDWMASVTQRTRIWANCKREWRTGKPGGLQFMGLQRVRNKWLDNIKPTQHFYYCNFRVKLNKGTKYVFAHVIMISTLHFFVWICVSSDMTFLLPEGFLVTLLVVGAFRRWILSSLVYVAKASFPLFT